MSKRRKITIPGGFTLVELMAVVLIICLLSAITLGVVGYIQRRVAIATTRAQLAAIETALESYKGDWGYYPRTSTIRISSDGYMENSNNAVMYRALSGTCYHCTKSYLQNFPTSQVRADLSTFYTSQQLVNIFDVYGKPFNYFCSPETPFGVGNRPGLIVNVAGSGPCTMVVSYTTGGQVNRTSFDLFSYGEDKITYSGTNMVWPSCYQVFPWNDPKSAIDDVTNWNP